MSNPLDAVTKIFKDAFSMDTLEAVFQSGIGFGVAAGGARFVYRGLITDLNTPVGRVASHLGVTIAETLLLGYIGGPKMGTRALTGGLLATAWQGLTEAVADTPAAEYIPTLGEGPSSEEFRQAIESEVLKEIHGARRGGEGMSIYLQPAGVSDTYLSPAGASAYLTEREVQRAENRPVGMSAYLTEREAERAQAGMGQEDGEFGSSLLPEAF